MVDVIAAVDSSTGAFGPLVQNRLKADMQTAINQGVQQAVSGATAYKGDTGATGATGPTGPAGPTGPQGPVGPPSTAAPSTRNAITGWFHVEAYGATGDGSTDDSAAIQAAVDAAAAAAPNTGITQRVFFQPKLYIVGARPMYQSGGNQDGICSIQLKSGVELYAQGARLRVKANAYGNGAYYGIVRSVYEGLNNAGITGLYFDGNRANNPTSNNAGNILLEAADNVWVDRVTSIESNGNGIMVRGNAYGNQARNIRIYNCFVVGVNGIGIQSSQFDGLQILGCRVESTTDNGIDVYGEYGNTSTYSHGTNFQINDNTCRSCGTGIFLETVAYGVVVGNRVSNCPTGLRVNRINGQPTSLGIKSNGFFGCAVGAAFSGVHVDVQFSNNEVQNATTAGIQFDGLQSSGLFGTGNLITTPATNVPLVLATSYCSQLSRVYLVQTMTDSSLTQTFASYAGNVAQVTIPNAGGPGF